MTSRRYCRSLSTLAACLAWCAALLWSAKPSAAQGGPTIVHALLLHSGSKLDPKVQEWLQGQDIEVVTRPIEEPLSLERLRQFHVVIIADWGGLGAPIFVGGFLSNYFTLKRNLELLHEYVVAGGGLFFQPAMSGGGMATSEGYRSLLDIWDITIPPVQVRDDRHAHDAFSWTGSITEHAATRGVKRVYYPTNMLRWDDAYSTNPLELRGKAWTVLVRGAPESTAARGFQYTTWMPRPGGAAPPIAAVREAGRGRVAVLGIHGFYTLFFPYFSERDWIGESHTGIINGIVLEKGNGTARSDVDRLMVNTLRWLAEPARAVGMGTYTAEAFDKLPVPAKATAPEWLTGWRPHPNAPWRKVLIGARTAFSDGKGTVAEFAAAAKAAGYSLLIFTETFECLPKENWSKLVADCAAASDADLVALPGLDLRDPYGNRYLLMGQSVYPEPFMLTSDGKAMAQTQNFLLGFAHNLPAIHRPGSTPAVHQLYKHFCALSLYTYREGKLVDNGMPAYLWQSFRLSNPLPLVVHETYSPDKVSEAAVTGHQLYVPGDTVENAAWYFRNGHEHYFENAPQFLVTSGPRITSWGTGGGSVWLSVEGEEPIEQVELYTNFNLTRRWLPRQTKFEATAQLNHPQLEENLLVVRDAKGQTAISSVGKTGGAAGYRNRCSDRQNWIGFRYIYTGTHLGDVNISVPIFGADEGQGLWPQMNGPQRGENLLPIFDYAFVSPAVDLVDAFIDQRYYRALWEETVFDAKPFHDTVRSRVYEAKVRDFSFPEAPASMKEITITLKRPAEPQGRLFPSFTAVAATPACGPVAQGDERFKEGKLISGAFDLPVGGYAGGLIALTEGLRVAASGQVGFRVPEVSDGPLPAGTTWRARFLQFDPQKVSASTLRKAIGLEGPPPYQLKLTRGQVSSVDFVARTRATDYGIAGQVVPGQLGYALPLFVAGLNYNWEAGVWRADGTLTPMGVFEGTGVARLDVSRGGAFFAGNIVRSSALALRLAVLKWDDKAIQVEAHNPTDHPLTATAEAPEEIAGKCRLRKEVTVPPGTTVVVQHP